MANFHTQLERSKAIQNPTIVTADIFVFIRSIEKYLIKLNTDQIEVDSMDIFGKPIGFYSKATDIITGGKKAFGDPFTGRYTGEWMRNWYVTVLDNQFYFGSSDPKTDDILDSPNWLSKSLFGLTDDNLNRVINDEIKPFVQKYYREKLGL